MLKRLQIRNFALITELEIEFSDGLNVLTGETGAGKSIVLDALSAVLGGKTEASMIRAEEERAAIEAVFSYAPIRAELNAYLAEQELLDEPDDDEIILSREIRSTGRSTARANGRPVTQAILREIGAFLVDIHGQSDHLSLLNPASHLALIDRFAGNEEALALYRAELKTYRETIAELAALRGSDEEKERRRDFILFQLEEIDAAKLRPEEETPLTLERDRIGNAEALNRHLSKGFDSIDGRGERQPGILDQLGVLQGHLERIVRLDPEKEFFVEIVLNLIDEASRLSDELHAYREEIDFDPKRLNEIEERLQLIHDLERKYGGTVEAVLAYAERIRQELETIENAAERIEALSKIAASKKKSLALDAEKLSAKRHEVAAKIARRVESELKDLSMGSATFEISLTQEEDPDGLPTGDGKKLAFGSNGYDRGEFLIAPNRGEGVKPLAKIASGGETSRLMLALKNTLADADDIPTMIFDEIDTGISGRVGASVGEKLWRLSRNHQVICITHLPQLAAYRDAHFQVSKSVRQGRTETVVIRLNDEASLREIAAVIGGTNEENLLAAKAMIAEAEKNKNRIVQ